MGVRHALRNAVFRLTRKDLADFLDDHEDELIRIFREEMNQLDEDLPEENLFIDIRMVPLGEALLKTALRAARRFLRETHQLGAIHDRSGRM
jgi:hypothetical protein